MWTTPSCKNRLMWLEKEGGEEEEEWGGGMRWEGGWGQEEVVEGSFFLIGRVTLGVRQAQ